VTDDRIVVIDNLVKNYGRLEAVRGISLDVRPGEVFGFLGPNGAGKSTTLRCLVGLLRPTAGRMRVLGLDPVRNGARVRRRLTYVPGELRLPDRVSGTQLVDTVARLRGGIDGERRDQLAERLQLDLRRPVAQLSTGNRRKLALLLAFAPESDLLVLDEPTNGLDPLMQREFLALVGEAQAAGTTVFLSSHVLSEVQRAADRIAVLREGKIIALGSVQELRRRARQRVEIWFDGSAPLGELDALPDIVDVRVDGRRVAASLCGPIQPLLRVLARHRVESMLVEEPDLEEAFMDLYREPA
jgi:beta-exotoxin I transport system ATP-binding protein